MKGGQVPPRFCEANLKSLILTIGASPDLYCALPVLLMCHPSFDSYRAPMRFGPPPHFILHATPMVQEYRKALQIRVLPRLACQVTCGIPCLSSCELRVSLSLCDGMQNAA